MIRPLTFITLLLAAASGLYVYQTKHRAEVLDAKIGLTLRQVAAARERIGLLNAEWAWLNEPERLSQLAAQHLDLQPLNPARYVAFAELAAHLPAVAVPVVVAAAPPVEDAPAPQPAASVHVVEALPVQTASAIPAQAMRPVPVAAMRAAPPQPHPAPARFAVRASSAPEPVAVLAVRAPAFAPMLTAVAVPIHHPAAMAAPAISRVGLVTAQPAMPAVTSALGGFGRASLAPPIPYNGN